MQGARTIGIKVTGCLRVPNSGHRPSEDLHVALLNVAVSLRRKRRKANNGILHGECCRHHACAIEFAAGRFAHNSLDCIIDDLLERRFHSITEEACFKAGPCQRSDSRMNELPKPLSRADW